MKVKQLDKIILPVLIGIIFLLIILLKAIHLPITHDEKASMLYYPSFSNWAIMMYPDCWPNNHILNTLAIKLSFKLFGISPLAGRLPNIISFILYFTIIWVLAWRYFKQSWLYYALFIAMLCNPYLIDFFGLGRGYGMSLSLMVTAVYFLLVFIEERNFFHFWLALIFSLLAAYANFTLIIFLVALNITLALQLLYMFIKREFSFKFLLLNSALLLFVDFGFALLCLNPIRKIQAGDQLRYWPVSGFYANTVKSLVINSRYGVKYWGISDGIFAKIVVLLFLLMMIVAIGAVIKGKLSVVKNAFVVTFLLLFFTVSFNLFQTHFLGTPNLVDRMALSLYPLFIISFLFALRERFKTRASTGIIALLIVVIGICHQAMALNMKRVREWWYDANTFEVLNYLDNYRIHNRQQDEIQLNTSWWFNPSFSFYEETGKIRWVNLVPYHKEVDTTTNTMFYYCMQDDMAQLQRWYDPVLKFDGGARMLLKHK